MMTSPPKPIEGAPSDKFWLVDACVTALDRFLHESFKHDEHPCRIEERYFTQFDWFKELVPGTKVVLDIGCHYGRETFALLWCLKSEKVVGVDNCLQGQKLAFVKRISELLAALREKSLEYLNSSPENKQQFQLWYENQMPIHVRQGAQLRFYAADISNRDSFDETDDHFDLIYSRYVLDKIWKNSGEEKVLAALQTMRCLVKPLDGRIVIVLPSQETGSEVEFDQFERYLAKTGLTVQDKEEESSLGYLEWPETRPKGYICLRSS